MIFCHLPITFSKNSFRNATRVSNRLDPDQARRFVGPDLGPNCLQIAREGVKFLGSQLQLSGDMLCADGGCELAII